MTAMQLFFDLLKEYGIYDPERHNKTFNTYEHGSNKVQFFGLDEAEKIKSTEFNYIWMEEANEFDYIDYTNMKLRLSGQVGPGEINHLYLSLNPIDEQNYIATKVVHEEDVEVITSTFNDNPTLSPVYIKLLTDLMFQDANMYRIYALGQWGKLEGRIYNNYESLPILPRMEDAKWVYGLDFGLVNPSTLVKVYLLDGKYYIDERFYKTDMTNSDIIEKLSHEERGDIYADPTSRQMIAEIAQAGYTCLEGHKGVKESIDLCKRQKLYISQNSANIIKEIGGYSWKKDPQDPTKFLSEPVKYNDHAMDAMRYAIWGLSMKYGFATASPGGDKPIHTLTFVKGSKRFGSERERLQIQSVR